MRLAGVGSVTLAAAALLACAAQSADYSPARTLSGSRWVGSVDEKAERGEVPRLEFTREGRIVGFTGCNLLNGSYRLEGDRLEVAVATTKRACLGAGGQAEARLLAVLADHPRVKIGARMLTLVGSKGATFEFSEAPPTY